MTTDVSPSPTAGVASRRRTSPALLAAAGLYAAAAGHVIAALVHLSHGWSITAFFLVAAAVQVVVAGRIGRGTAAAGLVVAVLLGTLGLVLLYVASRTLNLPFGGVHTVHNDRPQDADLLGHRRRAGRARHPRHRAGPAARTGRGGGRPPR